MIVLDSSGAIALMNREDSSHVRAQTILRTTRGPLVVPTCILAEICYVLERRAGHRQVDSLIGALAEGSLMTDCGEHDFDRIRQLVARYQDLPLGFADAAVIACGERLHAPILTFDLRHFPVVAREGTFRIASENGP